jgi:3-hydroxy-3-methylglutaryl CoA synthase
MLGILAYGAYLPRNRLQRGAIHAANRWFAPGLGGLARGERATAGWDEDSITMGVEAARDALRDVDRAVIGSLSLASTTLPFADRLNAGIVKEALNLRDQTGAVDLSGSLRAGTSALLQALESGPARDGPHLCIASDMRAAMPASEAEIQQGDGAAAFLIGEGDPVARLLGATSLTIDFVDHYRMTSARFGYVWEGRWIRDEGYSRMLAGALSDALRQFSVEPGRIDHLIVPVVAKGVGPGIAKSLGVRPEALVDIHRETIGDTGAAHPLLLLVSALERAAPGDLILVAGFGQGCDVLLFEVTEAIDRARGCSMAVSGHLARRFADSNYHRYLFHRGLLALDKGMRAEQDQKQPGTTLWRSRKAVLGLVGSRAADGTVQFPRSEIMVGKAGSREPQVDHPLADRIAHVVTFTADHLTYSPSPPAYYGTIDFEGGGRMVAEFADVEGETVEVGQPMRMMFRIKAIDEQRTFIKYFWKAVPAY